MGILLGLLTALTWGGADFIARFATHRIGTLRSMLYMQSIGFLLLTISLPFLGGWGHLADGSGWQPWAWGFLAGFFNGDRKSTRLNSSHANISYAVFCLKKKTK